MRQHRCRITFPIVAAVLWLSLVACPTGSTPTGSPDTATKEDPMNSHAAAKIWRPAIPVIDAQAPKQYDTATFGLG